MKATILAMLTFLLVLPIVSAQSTQNSCLLPSEENAPIIAERILQTYSQIYDNEEEAVEAALDSLNKWSPENVDSNIITLIKAF